MVESPMFDVFLGHNSADKPQVRSIAKELKRRGLNPWLDVEQIAPGESFQDAIQRAIPQIKSAAICIGLKGLGKWQKLELKALISLFVKKGIRVIPVLLPNVNEIPEQFIFLQEYHWVNFVKGINDREALDNLVWGITGEKPKLLDYSSELDTATNEATVEGVLPKEILANIVTADDQVMFKVTVKQINLIHTYKQLHDSFRELPNLYELVEQERETISSGQTKWKSMQWYEPQIQEVLKETLNIISRASFYKQEEPLKNKISLVCKELNAAIKNFDIEQLERAIYHLNRILDREPSRLNTILVTTAQALQLSSVLDKLEIVRNELVSFPFDKRFIHFLDAEIKSFKKIVAKLEYLVKDHNSWQELDQELRRVDANLDPYLKELDFAVPDIEKMTQALLSDHQEEDWAKSLNESFNNFKIALNNEDPNVKWRFYRYYNEIRTRFKQVDKDLLKLLGNLTQVSKLLNRIS